jgi:hypothetical protein
MTSIDTTSLQDQIRDIKNIGDNTLFYFEEIPHYDTKRYQCCCVDCNRPATHHHKSIQNHIIASYCEYCKRRLEAYSLDDVDKSFKNNNQDGKIKK